MENHGEIILTGENLILPPEPSGSHTNSHVIVKQEEHGEGN
jgi:hypothetical protein